MKAIVVVALVAGIASADDWKPVDIDACHCSVAFPGDPHPAKKASMAEHMLEYSVVNGKLVTVYGFSYKKLGDTQEPKIRLDAIADAMIKRHGWPKAYRDVTYQGLPGIELVFDIDEHYPRMYEMTYRTLIAKDQMLSLVITRTSPPDPHAEQTKFFDSLTLK
ncbi:MAG: hypothetical protein QM831_30775 [Kofleriaceae bacterium]